MNSTTGTLGPVACLLLYCWWVRQQLLYRTSSVVVVIVCLFPAPLWPKPPSLNWFLYLVQVWLRKLHENNRKHHYLYTCTHAHTLQTCREGKGRAPSWRPRRRRYDLRYMLSASPTETFYQIVATLHVTRCTLLAPRNTLLDISTNCMLAAHV